MGYALESVAILTGSGTYVPPAGIVAIWVRIQAGGGGGGGATSGIASVACGGAAGAGGYSEKFIAPLAASYAYSVGTGGPGNAGANGTIGNNTTFGSLTANGGVGGLFSSAAGATPVSGVIGGAASGGDLNARGGAGMGAYKVWASTHRITGRGGRSALAPGGASIATAGAGAQAGNAGLAPTGGGGGGKSDNSSTVGGTGADGRIIIFEYVDNVVPPVPPVIQNPAVALGTVVTLTANQIYALPAGSSFIYYQGTQPQESVDQITWTNITNGTMVSGGFIRSTAADTIVSLKRKVM